MAATTGGLAGCPGSLRRAGSLDVGQGCSPDNAASEGFFGRQKTELFYSRDWLSTTIEEFIAAVDTYIRWYNEARIKVSLGSRSPIEHRGNLGIAA